MGESFHDSPLATTTPEQWQIECEQAVRCAGKLFLLARRSAVASAFIELLRTMPRSAEEMDSLKKSANETFNVDKGFSAHPSLFIRCAIEAAHFSGNDIEIIRDIIAYWSDFAEMPLERRVMLEASVVGTVLGIGMG